MTEERALAIANTVPTVRDQLAYAREISVGTLVPQAYRNQPANVLIAMGLGQSMGLSPAESLYRINVIQGKPTASAELIAAQVRKAGHKLRISKDEAAKSVTATIVRCDDPDYPFSVTRDESWARDMGLIGKENYRKQPMTMLTWRAITAVAREACPEALYGVAYTPDEMGDLSMDVREPVDLDPVRSRFRAYVAATGESSAAAMSDICGAVGAPSMSEMSAEQVDAAVAFMDGRIAPEHAADAPQDAPESAQEAPVEPDDVESF